MKVSNVISKIALFKPTQSIMSKASNPKTYEKINTYLPNIEATYATGLYIATIQMSKTIPEDRKPPLVWQSVIGGGAGLLFSASINRLASVHKTKICEAFRKMNIVNSEKIIKGMQVVIPLVITSLIMRWLLSVGAVPVSSWISEHIKKERHNGNNTMSKHKM